MTSATETFTKLTRPSQEAVSTAMRLWQDTVRTYTQAATAPEGSLPRVQATIDYTFDLAERVLADQREFTKALVTASAQALEAVAEQATHVATRATETMANSASTSTNAKPTNPAQENQNPTTPAPDIATERTATSLKRPRTSRRGES